MITASEDEIGSWNALDALADHLVVTSVGLFGYDLTDFLDECATLEETEECVVEDYAAFTGWAVGVNWDAGEDDTAVQTQDAVVFTDSLWSVEVKWNTETGNEVKCGEVDKVAADAPTDGVEDTADDGFAGFGAIGAEVLKQFAFHFFEDDADFYFEAEDTTSIWATRGAVDGVEGNVETAEFEFVGAASLTAATSVIVASLLF